MDSTSPTAPLAQFPPIPSPEYRSRAPEFYGFVAWTSTSILFVVYLLWALLPDEYIVWLGVEWYPSREWALLLPSYGASIILFTYLIYFSLALAGTPSFNDIRTVTDSHGHYSTSTRKHNPYLASAKPNAMHELYDIPIGMVNRVAYGPRPSTKPKSQTSKDSESN